MLPRRIGGGKRILANALLVALSLAIGLVALEGGGRLFATAVAKRGKLFQPDPELGWTPLPNLDLVRHNANGEPWHVVTDAAGIRGPATWSDDRRIRLLVLGDSFAFGEGVDLAARFDTLLEKHIPQLSVVNLGVMGYGPDQQLIRARPWKASLRRGDVLLLLTYGNDFYDLARTRHGGRAKPWLEESDGRLLERRPEMDAFDILRDRSYIFALLTRSLARLGASEDTERRLETVDELYRRWVVQEVADLLRRGVVVVIVHHGDKVFELPFDVEAMFERTCPGVSGCLALDEALARHPRAGVFLDDGHWAAGGHRIAAAQIAAYLRTLPRLALGSDRPKEQRSPVVGQDDDAAAPSNSL
jgi:hypothetical protein